ncbi:MAG: hypothetical protein AAGG50_04385 [Bacteroidota bacterium]
MGSLYIELHQTITVAGDQEPVGLRGVLDDVAQVPYGRGGSSLEFVDARRLPVAIDAEELPPASPDPQVSSSILVDREEEVGQRPGGKNEGVASVEIVAHEADAGRCQP